MSQKWAPIAKLRAAGVAGIATVFVAGGLTEVAEYTGLVDYGVTEAMIYTAVGGAATWLAGYWKRSEASDFGKGVIKDV